jgi:hypothetical protein
MKILAKYYYPLLLIVFMMCARVVITIPSATPLLAMSILIAYYYPLWSACILNMLILLGSNIVLSWLGHYSFYETWQLFMMSGVLFINFITYLLRNKRIVWFCVSIPCQAFIYWAWTNLDTFFATSLYPFTVDGFVLCYAMALPFLKNLLLGTIFWMTVAFCVNPGVQLRWNLRYD